MTQPVGPAHTLARRLRKLRREQWPGLVVTQGQLATALSASEPASVPLISSWESTRNPRTPPLSRLDAYATFFATRRSVESEPYRLLPLNELTEHERAVRVRLLGELMALRDDVTGAETAASTHFWQFPPNEYITIACAELPADKRANIPYANPDNPEYNEAYKYADLDALLELYAHIRAMNPNTQVNIKTPGEMNEDDYTAHLVVLGGVDWNAVTGKLLRHPNTPFLLQVERHEEKDHGEFRVDTETGSKTFAPVFHDGQLAFDIAMFYSGPNPYNNERRVVVCNGMHGRGTLGVTRIFTATRIGSRNEDYVRASFAARSPFLLISQVAVVNGAAVTPDWNDPETRLYEWHAGGTS